MHGDIDIRLDSTVISMWMELGGLAAPYRRVVLLCLLGGGGGGWESVPELIKTIIKYKHVHSHTCSHASARTYTCTNTVDIRVYSNIYAI